MLHVLIVADSPESLCRGAIQFVRAAAQAKAISVRLNLGHGVKGLVADEDRLTQILVNLLDNAVKFTPEGGTVGLEVSPDRGQERIELAVWDTGIGIAEADFDRLFQPFTQVDGQLSRPYGGIGLGLTLVRRLVELHGGGVALTSTPGRGSRFAVSLPWHAEDGAAPRDDRAPDLRAWASPPRLVIADDHEATLQRYADLLSRHGCQVVTVRAADEAMAQIRAACPDLVVLDLQLSGLGGPAGIRQIRDDPALAALPIIALSALVMPGDREQCLAAGAARYLPKPVSARALAATIAEVLNLAETGST